MNTKEFNKKYGIELGKGWKKITDTIDSGAGKEVTADYIYECMESYKAMHFLLHKIWVELSTAETFENDSEMWKVEE